MFIGTLIGVGWGGSSLQLAMTNCCAVFVALFGGYFLVSYLTNQCGMRYLNRPSEPALCQQFVGYSMVVTFVLDIVTGLFPSFLILQLIFQFYVVYVVWEGAGRLMKVEENKRLVYTLSVSVLAQRKVGIARISGYITDMPYHVERIRHVQRLEQQIEIFCVYVVFFSAAEKLPEVRVLTVHGVN